MGILIALFIAALSVSATVSILYLKLYFEKEYEGDNTAQYLVLIFAPIANAICVKVFAFIFWEVAIAFTSFENHRSIFEYEDFLVAKVFIFSILNTLNSFFLIAFVKTNTDIFGECVASDDSLD